MFNLTKNIVVALLLLLWGVAHAQEYPLWFYNQSALSCSNTVVGYAAPSFLADSAASYARQNGYENFARFASTDISGNETYWNSEIGMIWLQSTVAESFDSTRVATAARTFTPVDTFVVEKMIGVLLAPGQCQLSQSFRALQYPHEISKPLWTVQAPSDAANYYAVGRSPTYYYEASSWQEAEQKARLALARQVYTKIETLQKISYASQEITREEVAVRLHDVEVVSRWRDLKDRFFYVLLRMRKVNGMITESLAEPKRAVSQQDSILSAGQYEGTGR